MTTRCPATYERPGGREAGDRIVECHLQPGHPGEHEEDGTDVTWEDAMATLPCGCQVAVSLFETFTGQRILITNPAHQDIHDFVIEGTATVWCVACVAWVQLTEAEYAELSGVTT